MTDYKIIKAPVDDLAALKTMHRQQLTAPLDGMWAYFADTADHFSIILNSETIGYYAINDEQKLLQYYIQQGHDSSTIFQKIIKEQNVSGAIAATCDPHFFELCIDNQLSSSVNSLMYHVAPDTQVAEGTFKAGTDFHLLKDSDLPTAIDFAHTTLGMDTGWLSGYYGDLIAKGELFGLWLDGTFIATGERRVSLTQQPYADIGMIVSEKHRGQGLATNILHQLIHLCSTENRKAICSTEASNIAAQKAIAKAGMVSLHRIMDLNFSNSAEK